MFTTLAHYRRIYLWKESSGHNGTCVSFLDVPTYLTLNIFQSSWNLFETLFYRRIIQVLPNAINNPRVWFNLRVYIVFSVVLDALSPFPPPPPAAEDFYQSPSSLPMPAPPEDMYQTPPPPTDTQPWMPKDYIEKGRSHYLETFIGKVGFG